MTKFFMTSLLALGFAGTFAFAQTDAADGSSATGTTQTEDANGSMGDNTAKPSKSAKHKEHGKKHGKKKNKKH